MRAHSIALVLALIAATGARAQDLEGDLAPPRAVVVDLSPHDTVVLTGDDLVRRGFRTLGDALAYELGVVRTRTGRGLEYALFGVPAGIALVIDGVPSVVDGERDVLDVDEMVNLADVERVEISRGPATALAGAGALVGVVRVTTRKPGVTGAAVRGGGTVFVDGTSNATRVGGGEKELAAEGTLREGDLGARASVRIRSGPPMRWRMSSVPARFETIGKVTLPVSARSIDQSVGDDDGILLAAVGQWKDIDLRASYGHTNELAPVSSFSHGFVVDDPETTTRDQFRARLHAQQFLGPVHVEASLSGASHSAKDRVPLFPAAGEFPAGGLLRVDTQAITGDALVRADAPIVSEDHRVLVAAFGDVTQLSARSGSTDPRTGDDNPKKTKLDDTAGGASVAAEYQGDFPFGLHATVGCALEWRTGFPVALAPRVGVAWDLVDELTLRAGYAEGTRTPDRFDLESIQTAIVDGRAFGVKDNDALRPEHVRMIDAGAHFSPSAALRLSVRAFGVRHEDALAPTVTDGVVRPSNRQPRLLGGGELNASVAPLGPALTLAGGASLARTVDGPDLGADAAQAVASVESRPFVSSLSSSFGALSTLTVGGRARAVTRLGLAERSPDAAIADVYAALDPLSANGALTITLAIRNVLDANEATFDDRALPFAQPALYPGAGRSVLLSVEGRL